ncbi:Efflux pump periplasmic linker BepD [Defluviimonas aquaemixtae]|uniref:Efflux pump periplasmic linker BepD n=1 Tax=Albidovulum aquaemixtae TaxID=1542388 RepID=A0A2R8BIU0_9RHOB|nr:efflux RND transporter periplasmic adaptor subunit [Defluviimonas aquaemixtae]SPH23329.1 Efflux pump periplasmic linker BepD [Defluviimonas aquaemixtae]
MRNARYLAPVFGAFLAAWFATVAVSADLLRVEIVQAEAMPDSRLYSLTGEVRPRDSLTAAFPSGGRVTEVLVDAGDEVQQDAVLARMQAVQQQQARRAAEAGLSTATADYRQAVEDLQRQDALLQRGATTRIARDSAEDALRIAEGVLAQASADLDRAEKALADTVLLAPGDATVTQRMVEAGQVVGAAQPVFELALGSAMDAVFDVPEVLLSFGAAPPVVTLNPIDDPNTVFHGHIDEISPVVDAQTGTVAVTVAIDNPPERLSFGEAVRGSVTREGPELVVLPWSAMSATAGGPAVWRVDPDTMTVTLQPVEIERFETGRILIKSGIEDGDLVVGAGAQLLYPGRTVRAAEEIAE